MTADQVAAFLAHAAAHNAALKALTPLPSDEAALPVWAATVEACGWDPAEVIGE